MRSGQSRHCGWRALHDLSACVLERWGTPGPVAVMPAGEEERWCNCVGGHFGLTAVFLPLQVRSLALCIQHGGQAGAASVVQQIVHGLWYGVALCQSSGWFLGVWHAFALCPQEVSSSWPRLANGRHAAACAQMCTDAHACRAWDTVSLENQTHVLFKSLGAQLQQSEEARVSEATCCVHSQLMAEGCQQSMRPAALAGSSEPPVQ